jgi:CDP-paratose 2-epimerase
MGFGGEGLQVRDVLHVDDLYDLLVSQLKNFDRHTGRVYNVGGGMQNSVSLRELSALCQRIADRKIEFGCVAETRDADIPYYVSDCQAIGQAAGWKPQRSLDRLLQDIWRWLTEHRRLLEPILSH